MAQFEMKEVFRFIVVVFLLALPILLFYGLFETYHEELQVVSPNEVGIHLSAEVIAEIESMTSNTTTNHLICVNGNISSNLGLRNYNLNKVSLTQSGENVAVICPDTIAIIKLSQHDYFGCEFGEYPTQSEMKQFYNQRETLKLNVCVSRWNGWLLKLEMKNILQDNWVRVNRTVLMRIE